MYLLQFNYLFFKKYPIYHLGIFIYNFIMLTKCKSSYIIFVDLDILCLLPTDLGSVWVASMSK